MILATLVAAALSIAPADAPRPLLVLLHGAGDDGQALYDMMRPLAEAEGVEVLLARSGGRTWDLIGTDMGFSETPRLPAGDRKRIERDIASFARTHAIDPDRVGLLGFSDGATYALTLGTADPRHYSFIGAIAPGGMLLGEVRGTAVRAQRAWIAHGDRDPVFRPASSRDLCRELARSGRTVAFHLFAGGHRVDRDLLQGALDRFTGKVALDEGCGA